MNTPTLTPTRLTVRPRVRGRATRYVAIFYVTGPNATNYPAATYVVGTRGANRKRAGRAARAAYAAANPTGGFIYYVVSAPNVYRAATLTFLGAVITVPANPLPGTGAA